MSQGNIDSTSKRQGTLLYCIIGRSATGAGTYVTLSRRACIFTDGRDPPLAQCGRKKLLGMTLDFAAKPARCPQPLTSLRPMDMLHCLMFPKQKRPRCAREGSRPPVLVRADRWWHTPSSHDFIFLLFPGPRTLFSEHKYLFLSDVSCRNSKLDLPGSNPSAYLSTIITSRPRTLPTVITTSIRF